MLGKAPIDEASARVVRLIDTLEPYAPLIEAVYRDQVDRAPVCGWLAMWCELDRRSGKQPVARLLCELVRRDVAKGGR